MWIARYEPQNYQVYLSCISTAPLSQILWLFVQFFPHYSTTTRLAQGLNVSQRWKEGNQRQMLKYAAYKPEVEKGFITSFTCSTFLVPTASTLLKCQQFYLFPKTNQKLLFQQSKQRGNVFSTFSSFPSYVLQLCINSILLAAAYFHLRLPCCPFPPQGCSFSSSWPMPWLK